MCILIQCAQVERLVRGPGAEKEGQEQKRMSAASSIKLYCNLGEKAGQILGNLLGAIG
jgi:hypothetical protein